MMLPRCKLVRASHHYVGSITAVSGNEPALIPEEHRTERVGIFLLLEIVKVKGSKGFVFEVKIIHW